MLRRNAHAPLRRNKALATKWQARQVARVEDSRVGHWVLSESGLAHSGVGPMVAALLRWSVACCNCFWRRSTAISRAMKRSLKFMAIVNKRSTCFSSVGVAWVLGLRGLRDFMASPRPLPKASRAKCNVRRGRIFGSELLRRPIRPTPLRRGQRCAVA
jgi:hypothetical protein